MSLKELNEFSNGISLPLLPIEDAMKNQLKKIECKNFWKLSSRTKVSDCHKILRNSYRFPGNTRNICFWSTTMSNLSKIWVMRLAYNVLSLTCSITFALYLHLLFHYLVHSFRFFFSLQMSIDILRKLFFCSY